MAYEKTIWKNREVERPRTFEVQENDDNTITLIASEGDIIEAGTPILASTMNKIEEGIEEAHRGISLLEERTDHIAAAVNEVQEAVSFHLTDYEYQIAIAVGRQIQLVRHSSTNRILFRINEGLPDGDEITISLGDGDTELPLQDFDGNPIRKLDKGYWEVVYDADFFILRPRGGGGEAINGQEVIRGILVADVLKMDTVVGKEITSGYENLHKLPNPAMLPTGEGRGCSFSPDGNYLAVAHSTSPFITIYKRNGDVFSKLPNPATLPAGTGYSCSFSPDGNYLAVAHAISPFITIYKRNGDVFSKLSNPTTLPTGIGYGCSFSPDGNYLAVAHSTSPFITIYKRNGDVFSKLPNPTTLLGGVGRDCSFSADGNYLAVVHQNSPYLTIYKRNGDVFSKLPDPSILPVVTSFCCAFSPDSNYLVIGYGQVAPYMNIYKREEDTFIKILDPNTGPAGSVSSCSFSADGDYLAIGHSTSPFITIYKREVDMFIKLSNPDILPGTTGSGCTFSPEGNYLAVVYNISPFISIYKPPSERLDIIPANNLLADDYKYAGYANQNGSMGQEIEMVRLFEKI